MNIPLLSLKVFHHKWAASANVILITLILAVAGCDTSSSAVEKWKWSFSTDFGRLPLWSPDGERIAFASERDGNPELYVMNADGSAVTRLTYNDAADIFPAWSPNGNKIAFQTAYTVTNSDIYITDSDTENFVPDPPQLTEYNDFKVRLLQVVRYEKHDTLIFKIKFI